MIKLIKRTTDNKFLQSVETDSWVDNVKDAFEMTYKECETAKPLIEKTIIHQSQELEHENIDLFLSEYFINTLKSKLSLFKTSSDKFNIFNPFQSTTSPGLSDYLHFYTNLQFCKIDENIELENLLVEKISQSLSAKENYGTDAIVTSLKSKLIVFNKFSFRAGLCD